MDKGILKERFEYMIGFLALIISLSNFKDELKEISINLILFSFTLADYFLVMILVAVFCLHIYFIPQFITSNNKIAIGFKKSLFVLTYTIFFIIVTSPFILSVLFLIAKFEFLQSVLTYVFVLAFLILVAIAGSYGLSKLKSRLETFNDK